MLQLSPRKGVFQFLEILEQQLGLHPINEMLNLCMDWGFV